MMNAWLTSFDTVAWVAVVAYVIWRFGKTIEGLLEAVRERIRSGSTIKAGPFELGRDNELQSLEKVVLQDAPTNVRPPEDWSEERNGIYKTNDGLFLAHVLEPSKDSDQLYDIFVFLVRHKSDNWSDIEYAEFFFGTKWGDRVFRETPRNGLIGISTSAYGPFLCTCHVRKKDGGLVRLHRYIDFEMARLFDEHPTPAEHIKEKRRPR